MPGIYHRFAMRFIKVKDLDKVDWNVVTSNDDNFDAYLEKAKENRLSKLKELTVDPGVRGSYTMGRVTIPEGTQVVTFGNDATDRRGRCGYKITFCYKDEKFNYSEYVNAGVERNRFMVMPKQRNSRLLFLDYLIDYEKDKRQSRTTTYYIRADGSERRKFGERRAFSYYMSSECNHEKS